MLALVVVTGNKDKDKRASAMNLHFMSWRRCSGLDRSAHTVFGVSNFSRVLDTAALESTDLR